jgi:hypothetical protein
MHWILLKWRKHLKTILRELNKQVLEIMLRSSNRILEISNKLIKKGNWKSRNNRKKKIVLFSESVANFKYQLLIYLLNIYLRLYDNKIKLWLIYFIG